MSAKMQIPKPLLKIIDELERCGYRADIVGGSVRDFLLGGVPKDYDLATDATPDEVISALSGYRVLETGIKHGTVTVMADGEPYEITTYRIDGEYNDSRHPSSVTFTRTLADDLARRDFTMNALAYGKDGSLTDLYGGEGDIRNKTIRAVGVASERFTEDALRIMRALRFSSVLGFKIEKETAEGMLSCRELIKRVSAERIYSELKKLVLGKYALGVMKEHREVLLSPLPELPTSEHIRNEGEFYRADLPTRLAALFARSPLADFSGAMLRLKADNKTRIGAETVISVVGADISTKRAVKRLLAEHGREAVERLFAVRRILGEDCDGGLLDEALTDGIPYKISELAVCGNDLIALGLSGEAIGKMLSRLLSEVIEERLHNEREALLSFVTKSI